MLTQALVYYLIVFRFCVLLGAIFCSVKQIPFFIVIYVSK
jgi:hypothetical protein